MSETAVQKKKNKSPIKSYLRRFFLRRWLEVLTKPTALLSRVVPKRKRLVVFCPIFGKRQFSGNIKEVFLWYQKYAPDYHCIWLCVPKALRSELRAAGHPVPRSTFSHVFYLLRADYVVIDTFYPIERGFLPFSYGRFRIIQLWHGTGYKQIGFSTTYSDFRSIERKRHPKQIQLILAGSIADQKRLKQSFLTDAVFVTGLPRNDLFYRPGDLEHLRAQLSLTSYNKIILYAPTFRDSQGQPPLDAFFWQSLQQWLAEENHFFLVKRHYCDSRSIVPSGCSHIRDVTAEVSDTQELLTLADMLVTDYSSIATDYSITRKPIILFAYDLEEYLQTERHFFYNIHEILPGPLLKTAPELLVALKDMSWFETAEHQEEYRRYRGLFHQFDDGNSTERVGRKMLEMMSRGRAKRKGKAQVNFPESDR